MAATQIRGNKQVMAASIGNAEIATDAAIVITKLEVLASNAMIIGDGATNQKVAISGDITIDTAGTAAIGTGVIVNADVKTDAAIAVTKLEDIGSNAMLIGNGATNQKAVISGDIAIDTAGVAAISTLVIIDADVATAASIAESKLAFDTGTDGHDHDGTNSRKIDAAGGFDVARETPTGTVNGTNTLFTLATTPVAGSEHLFLNGLLMEDGTDADYTIATAIFTMIVAPPTDDRLLASYNT